MTRGEDVARHEFNKSAASVARFKGEAVSPAEAKNKMMDLLGAETGGELIFHMETGAILNKETGAEVPRGELSDRNKELQDDFREVLRALK